MSVRGGPHDLSSSRWHANICRPGWTSSSLKLCGRFGDLQRLEDTARRTEAEFIEVVLMDDRSRSVQRFLERAGPKTEAFDDEDPSTGFLRLYDRLVTVLKDRPRAVRVDSVLGQIDQTYAAFLHALNDPLEDTTS